jgi:hypothetical protein
MINKKAILRMQRVLESLGPGVTLILDFGIWIAD